MAKWQYFIATGKEGGTANKQTDKTFYVDSYKGLDSNTGAYNNPYKTIQKVLDECASAGNGGAIQEVDIIATGYFEEGDFLNKRSRVGLIAEGKLTLKAGLKNSPDLSTDGSDNFVSFNGDVNDSNIKRNFGRIFIEDYPQEVRTGAKRVSLTPIPVKKVFVCNTTFLNCTILNQSTAGEGMFFDLAEGCVIDCNNTAASFHILRYSDFRNSVIQNNTFINIVFRTGAAVFGQNIAQIRNNYFGEQTKLVILNNELTTPFYNNHIFGTLTNKITGIWGVHTNRDAAHAVSPTRFDVNGISSAVNPDFNDNLIGNTEDYTLKAASPLVTGGFNNTKIGAFGLALGAQSTENANWVATGVDNTTVNGSAELTASPTGTMVTTNGIQVVSDISIPRRLLRLTLPDALIDYQNGQTINTLPSSGQDIPAIETVEIQVSSDSTNGIDGTWTIWMKVPIEGLPLMDAVEVGNGDDSFNPATQKFIELTFIKYRITLRDNEVSLP